jgi:two-component system response regulator AtoC
MSNQADRDATATLPEKSDSKRLRPRDDLQVLVISEEAMTTHPLRRGVLVVGRGKEADILVPSAAISRRHARFFVDDRIRIEDCGSRNGTFVRGAPLRPGELAELATRDLIELGASVTLVLQPRPPERQAQVSELALTDLERLLPRIARSSISVILGGETGVGKEVLARRMHAHSARAAGPLVVIHCAAVSESLLESELFGHERGAFTGAAHAKIGLLEAAHRGTVFLDEVGEMPPSLQVKLLRVLEQREVLPVGSTRPRAIDVRVIAATHRDLAEEVRAGRFRQDLWFRLNGITLRIPPLRERQSEIEPLARQFAAEAAAESGDSEAPRFAPEALLALRNHPWPGNVRELKNVVRRAMVLAGRGELRVEHLLLDPVPSSEPAARASAPAASTMPSGAEATKLKTHLRGIERQSILDALAACGGNQSRAAKRLGIARGTLIARMDEYGLTRPRKK